jgi:hypothetical protein
MTTTVEAHIANSRAYWGISQFRTSALRERVKKVHFYAHPNRDNQGGDNQPPTNHWTLLLEIDSMATTSEGIDIDMVPGNPFTNDPGMIILGIVKDDNDTNEYVCDTAYGVPRETTVESILQLIIDHGRDRYRFDPIGEGCRYWHSTVAMDMAAAGLISHKEASKARSALAQYWFYPPNSGSESRAMREGTFL